MGKKGKSKTPVKTAKVGSGGAVALALPPPTGMLSIQVVAPDDSPLEASLVTITDSVLNTASLATNDKGMAEFGTIPVGLYEVKVEKRGCGPSAGTTGPVVKNVNVPVDTSVGEKIKLYAGESVTSIKAMVPGTKGTRKATDKRHDSVLTPSSSKDESLSANAPVILIRGCTQVELEAVTTPAGQQVDWSIIANENTDSPPALTILEGGKKAKLPTGVHGSFSVIARLGITKIVWNVVFVWVKPLIKTSNIQTRKDTYNDSGSGATSTRFRSGEFPGHGSPEKYPWNASITVKVIGGGKNKTRGVGKVKIHFLQNGSNDTLTGNYQDGGTALEVPAGGLPVLDSSDDASADPPTHNPFAYTPGVFEVSPSNSTVADDGSDAQKKYRKREFWIGDSPAGGFPNSHLNTHKPLRSISGVNAFLSGVASVSDDAPDSINVHAKTTWSADFSGKVDYSTPAGPTVGKYKPDKAKTTAQVRFTLTSERTGGQDAFDAGFEVFQPIFRDVTTKWTP